MKGKVLYRDAAGNTLVERKIASRGKIQLAGYNRQGRLVSEPSVLQLMRKAGFSAKRL